MNNKLIVFFEDNTNEVLFFDEHTSEREALEFFRNSSPNKSRKITKHFYSKDLQVPLLDTSSLKIEGNQLVYDRTESLKFSKMRQVKETRNSLIKNLDIPFMKALETENQGLKRYVISLKNFLRDLPDNLRLDELKTEEEIMKYNPFNNIFRICITDPGAGYTEPPTVSIEPPADFFKGFEAKAVALIKDGRVIRIEVTDKGCGYTKLPKVSISAPPSGKQAVALCVAIENLL